MGILPLHIKKFKQDACADANVTASTVVDCLELSIIGLHQIAILLTETNPDKDRIKITVDTKLQEIQKRLEKVRI